MDDIPPEVMRSWPEANYANPDYQGPQLHVVGILLFVLSVATVILRMWVRVKLKHSVSWDDWIMVASIPFILCATVTAIVGTTVGWGLHIWDQKLEWSRPSRLVSWLSQFLLVVIMLLVKLSILSSYLRFATASSFWYVTWGMIVLVLAWGIAFVFAMSFTCRPLNAYWDTERGEPMNCVDELGRTLAFTITNLVTDVLVLILPIPTLWNLRLPIRERMVVIAMMNMGLVACAASGVRIYYAERIFRHTYDLTWDGYYIWLWILVECNLAVICASIPTLRPLARKYFPNLGFKNSSNQSGSSYPNRVITPTWATTTYPPRSSSQQGTSYPFRYSMQEETELDTKGLPTSPEPTDNLGVLEPPTRPHTNGSPNTSWLHL